MHAVDGVQVRGEGEDEECWRHGRNGGVEECYGEDGRKKEEGRRREKRCHEEEGSNYNQDGLGWN